MVDRVLVTGGTGKTGALVAHRLVARGVEARVATRKAATPEQVRFEWGDIASYRAALNGVDAIYLVAPTDRTDHLSVMRPLLEQAVEQGVAQLVLLSASSVDEGGPMMGEVRAWLHANAPRWVVLRPSWFMQNFVTQHLPSIVAEGCIYSATQDGRIPFIDAADIAAVAVEAMVDPAFVSGERVLTGPESLSYDEVADRITAVAQRPIRHCRLSVEELARRYAGFGLPADYADTLARMDDAISQGSEDRTTREVEQVTGQSPTKLTDFLTANRDAYHELRTV
ncbi:NmrA-like protein [Sphingopyxis sp. H038]|uniref:NmrA family NAD(P)-binding protein n=1 Tax=unclassified Sphingopyxis TaxID=2614943 RepID=UPI0007305968|nr:MULTISPECIES: NAD(P)H-binding protein [unclassified Sphingopyxis]KTE02547.1 NmrA-like protein [Sphingopyxis sp. H012]KTE11108.1 NmrA-like protein [Sphingopyxis sp. H053]KTE12293.1 NmrA-like protein [Sphingopyxis sp. H093]KTE30591.1 NmrA-like protein [Sphingopyxis sp. H080]KTE35596.1 NmrA-like protein [Sphingopyxis sp. H038]